MVEGVFCLNGSQVEGRQIGGRDEEMAEPEPGAQVRFKDVSVSGEKSPL